MAQRRLAEELTTRMHGAEVTQRVIAASRLLFGGTNLAQAGAEVLGVLAGAVPTTPLAAGELEGLPIADALVKAGLAASKNEARRGLTQNGFSLNGAPVAADRVLGPGDVLGGGFVLLQKGKRSYALLDCR